MGKSKEERAGPRQRHSRKERERRERRNKERGRSGAGPDDDTMSVLSTQTHVESSTLYSSGDEGELEEGGLIVDAAETEEMMNEMFPVALSPLSTWEDWYRTVMFRSKAVEGTGWHFSETESDMGVSERGTESLVDSFEGFGLTHGDLDWWRSQSLTTFTPSEIPELTLSEKEEREKWGEGALKSCILEC